MAKLVLFNKPFNVLSQFTDGDGRQTLADYIQIKGVYAAGRLDKDSEGLLLLTDDGVLQNKIASPKHKIAKSYWVQVEGEVTPRAIEHLQTGVSLKDGVTLPAQVKVIDEPPGLWPRTPPIRVRKQIATQWLEMSIHEGKNRQVRRMTAAVGYPTLRLIRHRIGDWSLAGLACGQSKLLKL
jgi:23S rRNA pseudouridine2457 synthase